MPLRYYISIVLILAANVLFAQVKLTASVNSTTVGTGEPFEITFALNGNGGDFTPPDFSGFQVVGGPNQSQSMEMVNGTTTVSMSYGYDLVAIREGEFTIGAASVVVNGHRLTSNPIKIKVVKGRPVQQQPQQTQPAPMGNVRGGNTSDLSKLIFIRAVVDKTDVYDGEQITVDYKLYTRVNISQSAQDAAPTLNGFWNEDVKQQGQIQFHRENYKGQLFAVADLKKSVLFPQRTGNLVIDPIGFMFLLQVPVSTGDDVFDQLMGGSREEKYEVKSTPVTIHVKPLPTAGQPDSFAGAVGNFSIQSSLDKTELKANDALNYKVAISGSGNLKLLQRLATNFPADFEKYDPKIADTIRTNETGMSGTRYFTYLLIPRHQGDFTIDPFKFSYFNPATGRYYSLETKPFKIKVDKGAAQNNVTAFSDADKQDVKMLSKDIRYIKTGDADLRRPGAGFFGSFLFYVLLLLGPVAATGVWQYRNWLIKTNSDIVKVKSRRAGKIAAKHLANAQKQLLAGNSKAFYEAIFRGLYGYLSDKLNIEYGSLDKEIIVAALKKRGASEQVTGRLIDTLDLCEMARYAPVTHISEKEVFEKAKGVINDIEDEM